MEHVTDNVIASAPDLVFFFLLYSARLHQKKINLSKNDKIIMNLFATKLSIKFEKLDEISRLWMKTKLWICDIFYLICG